MAINNRSNMKASIDAKQVTFWDNSSGFERIVTINDLQNQDWENMTAEQLMNKLPVGLDLKNLVEILVGQIAHLSKKTRELEDTIADMIILKKE